MKRKLPWLVAAVAVLVGLNYWVNYAFDMCGEETMALAYSPSGEFGARTIVGSCGATTPFFTKVELFSHSKPDESTLVFQGTRLPPVSVKWLMPYQLQISYQMDDVTEIPKRMAQWGDVAIDYRDTSEQMHELLAD